MIRPGIESDVFKLSRLWRKLVEETMPEEQPNPERWRQWTINALRSGNYFIFIAEAGGKIIGFSSFTISQEPLSGKTIAIGMHIYVLPEFRKGHIGMNLHRSAIKTAKEQGATKWVLYCTNKEAPHWMKAGFSIRQYEMVKNMEV